MCVKCMPPRASLALPASLHQAHVPAWCRHGRLAERARLAGPASPPTFPHVRASPSPAPFTPKPLSRCEAHSSTAARAQQAAPHDALVSWLQREGLPDQPVHVAPHPATGLSTVVASRALQAGETALRVPSRLVVTLDRVFESSAVAELLATNKLSELACLALYLCYEKKRLGRSPWCALIAALDARRARGPQGAVSPILWDPAEAAELLRGSPCLRALRARVDGLAREYASLDDVWFMAGSLFAHYPYEMPTEQFELPLFAQAFATVQSCVVHLQGVPLARRFAIVPLGPPLLRYSSRCRAALRYDEESDQVRLAVDRDVAAGEPLVAWCGPQPNSRLLINYGFVDPDNPYDVLELMVSLSSEDPLFHRKRSRLAGAQAKLGTRQVFALRPEPAPLPANLLSLVQLALAETPEDADEVVFEPASRSSGPAHAGAAAAQEMVDSSRRKRESPSLSDAARRLRALACAALLQRLTRRLGGYGLCEEEAAVLDAKRRVARDLVEGERRILAWTVERLGVQMVALGWEAGWRAPEEDADAADGSRFARGLVID